MSLPTVILRHQRENLKKCSLTTLETHPSLLFLSYPKELPLVTEFASYTVLEIGAPSLTQQDAERGLFIVDGTWRLAEVMHRQLPSSMIKRSLPPHFRTAYPRKQTGCQNPSQGLSSLEALYLSHLILGKSTDGFLDHYYWKDLFLILNDLKK